MRALRSQICWLLLVAAALLGPASARIQAALPAAKQEITVSAAVSLKDALDEIAQLYRAEKPDVAVHFNLGGSGTLQRQIEQGAPVDVFISASPDEMDKLEAKGLLLPGTRTESRRRTKWCSSFPVRTTGIASFQDLAQPRVKLIAIGEPQTVPAGKYAQQVLTHLGLYDRLKPKFVLAKDVRQVLTYVETGNVDAGIVYATDARISPKVKVVATAPAGLAFAGHLSCSDHQGLARSIGAKEFETFLQGAGRRNRVFQKFGFLPSGQLIIAQSAATACHFSCPHRSDLNMNIHSNRTELREQYFPASQRSPCLAGASPAMHGQAGRLRPQLRRPNLDSP